ncbi:SprT-like domain-containing protein [Clostridium sp. CF012]|uniref:SprT-like domain-containing protein n=1 Tax=Clostridium sp. CF012 TaxID=2843319 RepID=UPI001C0D38D7|nr:SprT-like domain-containing protein [Clostridium sp. CF012]MBU3146311.1 hypothetical protein [Clostridium sp. CF012]
MTGQNIKDLKYSEQEIIKKRDTIRNKFMAKSENVNTGNIQCMSDEDVKILFHMYDEEFFENYFRDNFKEGITFSLSTRMTSAAGKTIYSRKTKLLQETEKTYEIRMGIKFFFQYYKVERDKIVSGINTADSLEAFQIVFEHELCHLMEFHLYSESSCKKRRFKTMVNNIFAHTEVNHQLPSQKEIISLDYGFKIGQNVCFLQENKKYSGFIYKINKRATVMVKDKNGTYKDGEGTKYSKWYVNFEQLV